MQACADTLAAQAAATEPDFVALGGDLRTLFDSATELAQSIDGTATRLHASLAAQRFGGAGGLVAVALRAFHDGVQEVDRELDQLKAMTDGLTAMEPQLARIARVGVLLQTIAVGFAVESSRTAECQQAFGSFVDEIRGLSRRIATVENAISDELGRARNVELAGLHQLETELRAMHELSRQLELTSADAAGKVQEGLDRTLAQMEATRVRSAQIRRHTEEAVYQVQFGDITRQKIEHIVTVLHETADGAADGARDLRRTATGADQALAIQTAQLEAVGEELSAAQRQLEQAFARIAGATAEFVAPLQEQGGGESTRMQKLRTDFERLLALEGKGRNLRNRAAETAGQAFATAERLAERMQEVQSINREMHLLALNAIVKTAALGGSGATLEVLSMQVHALYREADDVVAGIGAQTVRLRRREESGGAAQAEGDAKQRLEEGVRQVQAAYEDFDRAAADAAARVGEQSARLGEASARLGALRVFAEQLHIQARELDAVRRVLAPWCLSRRSADALDSTAIEARYTMQSEREVHQRIAGKAEEPRAPAAPKAPSDPVRAVAASGAADSLSAQAGGPGADTPVHATNDVEGSAAGSPPAPSFGDNVELF